MVILKQNVAKRLFMEGPGQEKGTAVETAVPIVTPFFALGAWYGWRRRQLAVGTSRPAYGVDGKRGLSGCS